MNNTFQTLINYVKSKVEFSAEEEQMVSKYFEIKEYHKNEIILNAGEICNHLYFVEKGLIRTFHLNENGNEFTRLIVPENKFCTILLSFQNKIPSPATIQALENTTVNTISRENFDRFASSSENAKNFYLRILEEFQNFQLQRIEFLTTKSPKEKVEYFLKQDQSIAKRITNKVSATYLQLTPETFCREKKKLE